MSTASPSSGSSDIEQSALFERLDMAFTVILVIAGILTFPPACVAYWRMLTLKSFQGQYLMKLFVLNGASNMLIYLTHMVGIQFANWPSTFGFYTWLRSTFLSVTVRFLQDLAISVMWQTSFFISLNRLMSLKNQHLLSKYDFHYFLLACIFSLLLGALICSPLFFSQYSYAQFTVREGVYGYMPGIPKEYKWTSMPALVYQLSLAGGTLLLNVGISVFLVKMRREYSSKMKSRPENGLLLSSFIALLTHTIHLALKQASKIFGDPMIAYFSTLTIAISTTLPFWTMIVFAHTMRRAILTESTGFGGTKSNVRKRSGTKRESHSAQF